MPTTIATRMTILIRPQRMPATAPRTQKATITPTTPTTDEDDAVDHPETTALTLLDIACHASLLSVGRGPAGVP